MPCHLPLIYPAVHIDIFCTYPLHSSITHSLVHYYLWMLFSLHSVSASSCWVIPLQGQPWPPHVASELLVDCQHMLCPLCPRWVLITTFLPPPHLIHIHTELPLCGIVFLISPRLWNPRRGLSFLYSTLFSLGSDLLLWNTLIFHLPSLGGVPTLLYNTQFL